MIRIDTIKTFCALLLFLVVIPSSHSQEQITHLGSFKYESSSSPRFFVEFDNKLFFSASTNAFGSEIWYKSNLGDSAQLLKDINPGNENATISQLDKSSVVLNNTLYFFAKDGTSEGELWKTDGSTKGTEKVTNCINNWISYLTVIGNKLYFLTLERSTDSIFLWESDGTEDGTVKILDNLPYNNRPAYYGKFNGLFLFTLPSEDYTYHKIWRSDGTASGTYPITPQIKGVYNSYSPYPYVEYKNELYVGVDAPEMFDSKYGFGIIKIDSTADTSTVVTSFTYAEGISYLDGIATNDKMYFSTYKLDSNSLKIWESNGTDTGTQMIYEGVSNKYFAPSNIMAYNDKLVFTGPDSSGFTSLIKVELEQYTSQQYITIEDSLSAPRYFSPYGDMSKVRLLSNNKLLVLIPSQKYSYIKAWVVSFEPDSIFRIPILDNAEYIFTFKGFDFLSLRDSLHGRELWITDGTEVGTKLVDNINQYSIGLNRNDKLIKYGNILVFSAIDPIKGKEPWIYTNGNLSLLKDIAVDKNSSSPEEFTELNGDLYFIAYDSFPDAQVWKTDGSRSGTNKLIDSIDLGKDYYTFNDEGDYLGKLNDELIISARDDLDRVLYKYDGIELGLVKKFDGNHTIKSLTTVGDYLYFVKDGRYSFDYLWVTDGTENGTTELTYIHEVDNIMEFDGQVHFLGTTSFTRGKQLWSIDHNNDTASIVFQIGDVEDTDLKDLIVFKNKLYFTANTDDSGRELWSSDGTKSGTSQLIDLFPGKKGAVIVADFCIHNDELFFTARDTTLGFELWKTDGTESGTVLVKDINAGSGNSFPSELVKIHDHIYFQAYDPVHGDELWRTDGTKNGTELVADIMPGVQSSTPTQILEINEEIYFVAETIESGRQVWKVNYDSTSTGLQRVSPQAISVYPNPTNDFLKFDSQQKIENIYIYDNTGKAVLYKEQNNDQLNISHLTPGTYFILCEIEGQITNSKFIKQ